MVSFQMPFQRVAYQTMISFTYYMLSFRYSTKIKTFIKTERAGYLILCLLYFPSVYRFQNGQRHFLAYGFNSHKKSLIQGHCSPLPWEDKYVQVV
jgi:hypothetical protein